MKNKKFFVPILIILLLTFLYYLGILSFQELCGFRPGAMAKNPGKEWSCICLGKVHNVSSSYSEEDYCTGLNLSYNKLMGFFNKGQHPLYQRQRP